MTNVALVSVFIDRDLYSSCITYNPFVQNNSRISVFSFDNTLDNQAIPKRYNQFLDNYDYRDPAWFVFCHSDWEVREDLAILLEGLDTESIFGPIGAILCKNSDGTLIREYRGQCLEKKRDGSNTRQQRCHVINTGVLVDTLDCQCVMIHSSLVAKHALRFDERLNFNLYVEDFCINAKESHSIKSKIVNVRCCHWNQADNMDGREDYFVDLDYCNKKYSKKLYAGVVTLIGGNSTTTVAEQCEIIMPKIINITDSSDTRSTIYKVPIVLPDAPNDSKSILFRYVSPNSTVLDVGCACGDLGTALHQHKNCTVHGLEYNKDSVLIAQETRSYEQVRQADLNVLEANQYPEYTRKFDWIIFGDVLEHVYEPQEVLRKMLDYLKPEGRLLISLPNLAHASIKAGLLSDDFTYTDVGLLDATHIRFFTHKTIPAFLAENLLKLEDSECTAVNMFGFQPDNPYDRLSVQAKQAIFYNPHSFVCQYVMKVRYAPEESFESCLDANNALHTLDESRNPLLRVYREQAISTYAPSGLNIDLSISQRIYQAIYRSACFTKARLVLIKILTAILLVPSSMIYAGSLRKWLRGILVGQRFFVEILNNQNDIANKIASRNSFFYILVRKTLNRATLLQSTKSLRIAFGGLRSAFRNMVRPSQVKAVSISGQDGEHHLKDDSEEEVRYMSYMTRFEPHTEQDFAVITDEIRSWGDSPLLSLHVHAKFGQLTQLKKTIASVQKQMYDRWELYITFPANLDEETKSYLNDLTHDSKVHAFQMNANSNLPEDIALQACQGIFFVPLGLGDQIPSFSLYFVARESLTYPKSHIIYSDVDVLANGVRAKPFFKPDWNEELILGQDYICHLVAFKVKLLKEIGGFRKEMEPSQGYDATLRLALHSSAAQIRHIPRVLYHYGHEDFCLFTEAQRDKSRGAVTSYLQQKKIAAEVLAQKNGTNRVIYSLSDPLPMVSCIVAMRDKATMTENCIRSILQDTDYNNLEIILINNGSREVTSLEFLDTLLSEKRVRIINWDRPFNYSEIQNMAVKESRGQFIALLNNDIEIRDPAWLKEMISHAQKSHIGAVGTKLLFANETLQHGGIILGPNGCVGHAFRDLPQDVSKQKNIAQTTRWISAVTGACLVIDKQKYLDIGGLNEENLGIAFNDVDFCIRLVLAGYQNLYTPHTRIYHLESASRGFDIDPAKKKRAETEQNYIIENYANLLNADPHYNPNLSFYGTNYDIIATTEQSRVAN